MGCPSKWKSRLRPAVHILALKATPKKRDSKGKSSERKGSLPARANPRCSWNRTFWLQPWFHFLVRTQRALPRKPLWAPPKSRSSGTHAEAPGLHAPRLTGLHVVVTRSAERPGCRSCCSVYFFIFCCLVWERGSGGRGGGGAKRLECLALFVLSLLFLGGQVLPWGLFLAASFQLKGGMGRVLTFSGEPNFYSPGKNKYSQIPLKTARGKQPGKVTHIHFSK